MEQNRGTSQVGNKLKYAQYAVKTAGAKVWQMVWQMVMGDWAATRKSVFDQITASGATDGDRDASAQVNRVVYRAKGMDRRRGNSSGESVPPRAKPLYELVVLNIPSIAGGKAWLCYIFHSGDHCELRNAPRRLRLLRRHSH